MGNQKTGAAIKMASSSNTALKQVPLDTLIPGIVALEMAEELEPHVIAFLVHVRDLEGEVSDEARERLRKLIERHSK